MNDQDFAKVLAQRYDHAVRVLGAAHESDKQRIENAIAYQQDERVAHYRATGWWYMPGGLGPGRWLHKTPLSPLVPHTVSWIPDGSAAA